MSYISALAMRFKAIKATDYTDEKNRLAQKKILNCKIKEVKLIFIKQLFINFFFLATISLLLSPFSYAEVINRVVAIVDDEALMLSEFNEAYQGAQHSGITMSEREVLEGLINRVLLLKQARKFVSVIQTVKNENELISKYIEKRLKAFIRIPVDDIEYFYLKNRESFDEKEFYEVRDEIESYLIEKEVNKKLIKHIEELRERAYIRIQLREEDIFSVD